MKKTDSFTLILRALLPLRAQQLKKNSLFILGMLMLNLAFAQTRQVAGRIIDEKGESVPFATITESGTKNSVTADEKGNFRIKVAASSQISISATGFESKTVPAVNGEIHLAILSQQMKEVVVTTGLGIQRQAKEVGYATAKIRNAELTQAKAVNLQQGLVGKVSGLNITTTDNSVFENSKINLRGIRSLTGNNQPLLLLDGIPTPLGYISSINPNDVMEVNILKGASAAAIYGPDGANGVVVITTRKGTRAKPIVTASTSYQVSRVSYMPERQRSFGTGSSTDDFGNPVYDPFENYSFGDHYDWSMRPVGRVLEDGTRQMLLYAPQKEDQQKKFFNENGAVIQNDVSFASQDYYISAQDAKINGIVPKDENRRTSFRFNAGKDHGKFKSSFSLNYIRSVYDIMSQGAFAARYPAYNGSIYSLVMQTAAHIPLASYKDWRNDKYSQYSNYYNEYAPNPYWAIDNHRQRGRSDDLLGSLDLKFDVTPWMQLTARVGTNFSFGSYKITAAPIQPSDYARATRNGTSYSARPGFVQDNENYNSRINAEFFANGRKAFNDFTFTYLAGTQVTQNQSKAITVQGNNLVVPFLYNLANRTGEIAGTEGNFKSSRSAIFGSIGIGYKGWANVEILGRNDWDSRLASNNNSYFYPGVNASVVVSEAINGLKNSNTISYLKIRGALTKSGNVNLGTYALESTFSSAGGFPFGSLPGYSADNDIPDANLKPEFIESKELGFELGLLKNRFNLDITYFHQNNTNQILSIQTSATTGYTSKLANTADFKNYGVEMDIRLTPLVNLGKARIDFKINATYNDNEIVRLSDNANELAVGGSGNFVQLRSGAPTAVNFAIVGMPAFVFKLSDYERDPQGRVIVDDDGNPHLSDSLVVRGRTMPKWVLGFNPTFSWKGLTIGMTWDFKCGHDAFHGAGSDMDGYGLSKRSAQFDRQRFVFPNSVYWDGSKYVANTSRQVSGTSIDFWGNDAYNTQIATNYFSSAAAWKLRELAISYDLPDNWLSRIKVVRKATVSVIGRNLLTFLPESNQWGDPEFNYSNSNNTMGVSSVFQTPPVRTFGGSITLTF
jgi:TonB-linked SusC/RagA family outer membrane protein